MGVLHASITIDTNNALLSVYYLKSASLSLLVIKKNPNLLTHSFLIQNNNGKMTLLFCIII